MLLFHVTAAYIIPWHDTVPKELPWFFFLFYTTVLKIIRSTTEVCKQKAHALKQWMICQYPDRYIPMLCATNSDRDRQGATLQVARRKCIAKSCCFDVQKTKRFGGEINAFSPLFYRKWIWTMLIHGKCKFFIWITVIYCMNNRDHLNNRDYIGTCRGIGYGFWRYSILK